MSQRANRPGIEEAHEFHRHLDDAAEHEGIDDELLRHCERLLDTPIEGAPGPGDLGAPARERSRAARHLLLARLAYEAGIFDRAAAETNAALALAPGSDAVLRLIAALHHRRGRLSEAVAIWNDLGASAPASTSALRQLSHVFELALLDASTRARSTPAALEAALDGALLDLEQSFRLALEGNLPGALRAVDKVAARSKSSDRYLFKVAAIQRAWLLEQSNNIPAAIATMERLADEPGLANDIERLLCLSVLYEREGTPERVRRAVRAVRHAFLATGQATLLRRMARLLTQLGYTRLADRFEARYLELFRRRMHALTLRELLRAAASSYTPMEQLRAIAYPRAGIATLMQRHLQRKRPRHRARAALLYLLAGDLQRAVEILRGLEANGDASTIDRLYLADVEEALGDATAALALRALSVGAHAAPEATAWLKLLAPQGVNTEEIATLLGDDERAHHARRVLRAHAEANPTSAPTFRALAAIERATGREAAAVDHASRAMAIERSRGSRRGRVLAAAALRRGGEVHGLIHELWVDTRWTTPGQGGGLDPAEILGTVSPELRAYAVNVFYSVKAYATAHYPHRAAHVGDQRFILKWTKDDEPSSGDSAGLPMAVAFLSAFLDLPVPDDVAFSGAIVCDAHDVIVLRRIGDVEAKAEGAYERRIHRLFLPAENRPDVERAERVPRDVAHEMVFFVKTLDDVCAALFPSLRE